MIIFELRMRDNSIYPVKGRTEEEALENLRTWRRENGHRESVPRQVCRLDEESFATRDVHLLMAGIHS